MHVSAPALSAQQRRIELPVLVFPGAAIDGHLVAAVRVKFMVRVRDEENGVGVCKICLQSHN